MIKISGNTNMDKNNFSLNTLKIFQIKTTTKKYLKTVDNNLYFCR